MCRIYSYRFTNYSFDNNLFEISIDMDMGLTSQCIVFWTIVEREINTLIPPHLKNLLK